jgi:Tfp pilus assembly protein PilF/TolB-like protein
MGAPQMESAAGLPRRSPRTGRLLGLLVACWWISASSLAAQIRVGLVLPFENNTKDATLDWIGESFAETLTSDLASPRLLMIDRRERAAAFDQLGMPASSILSDATIYKVADAVDASRVVLGRYELKNNVFIATAQVLDMDSPSLSKSFTESGLFGTLLDIESGLAWQLQQFLRPNYPLSKEEYLAERKAPRIEAFENYVRGLMSKERSDQVRFFRTAQRLDAMYTKPAFELGMIYFHDKDYATSILWLSKLRRSDPDYLEASYFLGLAYLYQQRYEQSAAAFRVVEMELPLNEVYNNLGIALERLDRPGALQYFEKAAASNPADADYQFNLGFAQWKRSQFPEACGRFRKSLENSASQVTRAVYVECLKKIGRPEEAARQQQYLIAAQIPAAIKFENLERAKDTYDGSSFRQLRRVVELQEELKHTKLSPREHAEVHLEAAQDALKQNSERQAVDELEFAIDLDPENPRPYLELAEIHLKAGRLDAAAKSCDRALEADKSPEGYVLLARIYLAQGKPDEARAQIEDAFRLDPTNAAAASLQEEINARSTAR